jgi:hypothetical protein
MPDWGRRVSAVCLRRRTALAKVSRDPSASRSNDGGQARVAVHRCAGTRSARQCSAARAPADRVAELRARCARRLQIQAFHDDGFIIVPAEQMWTEADVKEMVRRVRRAALATLTRAPHRWRPWMRRSGGPRPRRRRTGCTTRRRRKRSGVSGSQPAGRAMTPRALVPQTWEDMKKRAPGVHSGAPPRLLQRIEKFLESSPSLNRLFNGPRFLNLVRPLPRVAAALALCAAKRGASECALISWCFMVRRRCRSCSGKSVSCTRCGTAHSSPLGTSG